MEENTLASFRRSKTGIKALNNTPHPFRDVNISQTCLCTEREFSHQAKGALWRGLLLYLLCLRHRTCCKVKGLQSVVLHPNPPRDLAQVSIYTDHGVSGSLCFWDQFIITTALLISLSGFFIGINITHC